MRTGAFVLLFLLIAASVRASDPPPDLDALFEFAPAGGRAIPMPEAKRRSAMRLAALGFGARAGLARRSWEIGVMLERLSAPLSAIYRFGEVLERWGARAGIGVLFLTNRRYRLHRGRAYEGTFIDAVRSLFFGLSHLPHPPAGEFIAGGKSLAVTHRAPQLPANGDKP